MPRTGTGSREVKFYRVDDDAEEPSRSCVSDYDYFRNCEHLPSHGIIVADPYFPVINIGSWQRPRYFPPHASIILSAQASNMTFKPSPNSANDQIIGVAPPWEVYGGSLGSSSTPELIAVPARGLKGPQIRFQEVGMSVEKPKIVIVPKDDEQAVELQIEKLIKTDARLQINLFYSPNCKPHIQ
ncbi:hypothetical protein PAAG_01532 [Paracoccidioides lutzii Pb01]|uniref:Uncharacterized protein n=1 Tax=Paracoccidioides lutzii (strain ATCC MYA-826 / Pb01) TaxID=502779 RepID=C1GSN7_PARBA|nr:hypothetical protein PAAG_01532 [Paracoccidioides lutzii Pb01]EEH39070.2 hypothetical protein PAAG_01532 [Paracoccidioides lutzii Pb01]